MPKAFDLLCEGRGDELWQMCCGYLDLDINGFMEIQESLLLNQLQLLNRCRLGEKIMRGARPKTVEEFRRLVPITNYKDYCPELLEKKEDILPAKPALWVHTSGRSGEYPCKWVPMTAEYAQELSRALFGVGVFSGCNGRGDTSNLPNKISVLYTVAPKPYISGTFAELLMRQWPVNYLPPLDEAQDMPFEDRIKLGFKQAMTEGFDYFFGLSLVLMNVGEKIRDASKKTSIRPYLGSPVALCRLLNGKLRSTLAGRQLLPRDLWKIKGIIGSGTDSYIYKNKIKELWGRAPLDLYSCTEGGVIASQTWDYQDMTFVPYLNFLEFIPEEEQLKLEMDRTYRPKTLLLNEVRPGESYEILITNFHGGAMTRYRLGDMITIKSLKNETLGINLPQMTFERRVDGMLDFTVVRLSEKTIWEAIESSGIAYVDWMAYKEPGKPILRILIELKDECKLKDTEIAALVHDHFYASESDDIHADSPLREEFSSFVDFQVDVSILPHGTFADFIARKQAEGADAAHLKPPHINPSEAILSQIIAETEEILELT